MTTGYCSLLILNVDINLLSKDVCFVRQVCEVAFFQLYSNVK